MWKFNEIINGNTITVVPTWNWEGQSGNKVRISGYNTVVKNLPDDIANQIAMNRLKNLLTNKELSLVSPTKAESGILHCEVLLNGVSLSKYFSDFEQE